MQITALPIIPMDRSTLGRGQELAGAVANELGYGGISKEVLVEVNRKYGIPRASRAMRRRIAGGVASAIFTHKLAGSDALFDPIAGRAKITVRDKALQTIQNRQSRATSNEITAVSK